MSVAGGPRSDVQVGQHMSVAGGPRSDAQVGQYMSVAGDGGTQLTFAGGGSTLPCDLSHSACGSCTAEVEFEFTSRA